MPQKSKIMVKTASIEDAEGILNALKQNLIDIRDVEKISTKQRKELEETGFLRNELALVQNNTLIEDNNIDIFIADDNTGRVIGFASIHRKTYDIIKVRDVIGNLSFESEKTKILLLNEETEFAYLDQVSILPEYKRKGVGTTIFQKALLEIKSPVVAFIVEKPIFNRASVYWHEKNGFILEAFSGGEYKGEVFKFLIYVNWNGAK